MTRIIIYCLSIFIFAACSDKSDPIGKWDDNIKLSQKSVEFSAGADSVVITTEGNSWWIDGILLGDSVYSYYGREDIDMETKLFQIREEDFYIRREDYSLFIRMEENSSGSIRNMQITLQSGNYFDRVFVSQSGK